MPICTRDRKSRQDLGHRDPFMVQWFTVHCPRLSVGLRHRDIQSISLFTWQPVLSDEQSDIQVDTCEQWNDWFTAVWHLFVQWLIAVTTCSR